VGSSSEESSSETAKPAGAPSRPKTSKTVWAIVIVLILVIASVAGAWAAGLIGGKDEGKVLVVAMSSDVETMDPSKTSAMYGPPGMVLETLITRDKTGAYQPGLATSYSWDLTNASAPKFVIVLKQGVTFHDGTPFNAQAVKDIVKWYKQADEDGTYGWVSYEFAAINCSDGTSDWGNMDQGIWVKNDYNLVFNCTYFDVALIFNLSHLYGSMMSPTAAFGAGDTLEKAHANYGTPKHPAVGTGPFKIKKWVAGDHVTLVKFAEYNWGFNWYTNKGPAHLDKIIYRVITDSATRFSGFEAGDIDVLMQVPPSKVETYSADPDLTVITGPGQGTYHIEFNCEKAPWTNASLRRAIGFAINRTAVVDTIWHGFAEEGVNYLSPIEIEGSLIPAQYNYSFNLTKSTELFIQAGYVKNTAGWWENATSHVELTLPLWTTNKDEDVDMSVMLQTQLQAAGLHVTLTQYEESTLRSMAASGDDDAMLFWYSWPRAEILDWHFGSWAAGGSSNTGQYRDPVFDDYVTAWTYAPTDAAFTENATLAHIRLLTQGPWAPIIFWHQIVAVHDYVTGWYVHPLGQEQVIDGVDVDITTV
jgi:peptide/nickel transport system substrate-binding protein